MKSFPKYLVVLLLFCSYGTTSFELNDVEKKENFSKEVHDYTLAAQQDNISSHFLVQKITDLQDFYTILTFANRYSAGNTQYKQQFVAKFTSPLRHNKIYLHNSVFLI